MLAFRTMQEYNSEGHNVTACVIIYPSSSWEVFTNILLNSVGFLLPLRCHHLLHRTDHAGAA